MQGQNLKPYVLGVDSGGTKYLVRAAAPDGTILAEYKGPSCSHYHFPFAEAARRICFSAFPPSEDALRTAGGSYAAQRDTTARRTGKSCSGCMKA